MKLGMLTGSLGMLPSANIGDGNVWVYMSPWFGSDIAGKDVANPIASIMSAAMMLKYSFGLEDGAQDIYRAVRKVWIGVIARCYNGARYERDWNRADGRLDC